MADRNIYFECPYGHTAKFELFQADTDHLRYGEKSTLDNLAGLKCLQCGRRFVAEQHVYPPHSAPGKSNVGKIVEAWSYELDGKWTGREESLSIIEFAQDRLFTDEEMRDYNQRKYDLQRNLTRLTEDLAVAMAEDDNESVARINAEINQVELQLERLRPVETA